MPLDPTPLEDIALMDVLSRIYNSEESDPISGEMKARLLEGGLVEEADGQLSLTSAGIAMYKSIRHRVEADRLAGQDGG